MSLFTTERVLVPVDFSDEAFEAQKKTLEFVESGSRLHLLHVLPSLNPAEPGLTWKTVDDQTRKQHVEKVLRSQFNTPDYEGVTFSVAIGDPGTEIVNYAKVNDINLIVMPSHGRKGLSRVVMGSVAERVVRFAPCPVLVLRS